jgi:hypothetical protein
MPSQNGSVYGLTLLCPIIDDPRATPSHDLQIRDYLAKLNCKRPWESPFAVAPGTHMARWVVLDDVIYPGAPSCEEHLKSKYLVFESNCDGDRDSYLTGLAKAVPDDLDAVWSHCVGYPGAQNLESFLAYMRRCEIDTTFYFAPVNDRTRDQTLVALRNKAAIAHFVAEHQGVAPEILKKKLLSLYARLRALPVPVPAAVAVSRKMTTGGRNE